MGTSTTRPRTSDAPILLQRRDAQEAQFYISRSSEGTVESITQLRAATKTLLLVYRKECGCAQVMVVSSFDALTQGMTGDGDLSAQFVQMDPEAVRNLSVVSVDADGHVMETYIDRIFTLEGAALVLDAARDVLVDHENLRVRDETTGELWSIGPRASAMVLAGNTAPNFYGLTIRDEAGELVEPFAALDDSAPSPGCAAHN